MQRIVSEKIRGIIVWDFDGVLFDTERYRFDNRSAWMKRGLPERKITGIIEKIRRDKKHFSVNEFMQQLKKTKYRMPERFIRRTFHNHLVTRKYYSPRTDRMLHRLKKAGFIQLILSSGHPAFQYKKMFVGCGDSFRGHFALMRVTKKPKFITLAKIKRAYPALPLIFIDDTPENLESAKKHVPDTKTVHYSNLSGRSLKSLEKKILAYAQR